jgi:hypothetical protein
MMPHITSRGQYTLSNHTRPALLPIPDLLRVLSADCPRRLAARIAEPCGAHLPQLAEIFANRPRAP